MKNAAFSQNDIRTNRDLVSSLLQAFRLAAYDCLSGNKTWSPAAVRQALAALAGAESAGLDLSTEGLKEILCFIVNEQALDSFRQTIFEDVSPLKEGSQLQSTKKSLELFDHTLGQIAIFEKDRHDKDERPFLTTQQENAMVIKEQLGQIATFVKDRDYHKASLLLADEEYPEATRPDGAGSLTFSAHQL